MSDTTQITCVHIQGFDCYFAVADTEDEASAIVAKLKADGFENIEANRNPVGFWMVTGQKPLREEHHA